MGKRKAEGSSDGAALKKSRLAPAITHNAPRPAKPSTVSPSSGDIGLIESITLKNFMCHRSLGPFQFGPNVNFIVGNNGSGKSAILTALIVGLGGKATVTNRGGSLKDFVKIGENTADITVKLRNKGADAFRKDVYGDGITVEHRVFSDGSRTCKLKNGSGQLVSTRKEELVSILDHFNIQLDNPVSILSQEMSKQFLHSKNETDKYKFFMKATLLEQMKRDYIHIKHTETITRQQIERQEESLKELKLELLQKKERYENLSSFSQMKEELEVLNKNMAWCLVREQEQILQRLKEDAEKEENNHKAQENLRLCQTKLLQTEQELQDIRRRAERLQEEQETLKEDNLRRKEEAKRARRAHKEQELVYFRLLNKLRQSEQEQNLLQEKIGKGRTSLNSGGGELSERQKTSQVLQEQLRGLEGRCSLLNEEIKKKQQALLKGKEERDTLRVEQRSVQVLLESKLKRRNQLLASRSNKLKRFGDHIPDLLGLVAEASAAGRFRKKPIGPIGSCISLKDASAAVAVECCLRSFLKAFCCDNYRDEAVLQELMTRFYPRGTRPQIIVSPFTDKLYNVHGRKARHPDFRSVLDVITATSPVILNCLIDMRGIESILIIKDKDRARRVMQQGPPPRNCREAFTAEGDQVFLNRYYTSDCSAPKYLSGDIETEISLLEAELENQKAHLSRFQLQVSSVSRDIEDMESSVNSTIMALKKTALSVNRVNVAISELETDEQADDIRSLEEAVQESRQKMEAERGAVEEAKAELDQLQTAAEGAESEFLSVRETADQLAEEMEPLKEEQLRLEAEHAKLQRLHKLLENKLKAHQDAVHGLRTEVSRREAELQEHVQKATAISPERQSGSCSAKTIDAEITRLKTKIQVYQSSHGDPEQLVR
uniref:Structural maintenance of chromosomes protein 6 n=2 Tax=Oryzias melastigma TaxID=30732 RepID=A0A3B3E1R5_ORYME